MADTERTIQNQPPPAPHEACDLCGVKESPAWSRWPEDAPCHGLRCVCAGCHAEVREANEVVLRNIQRLALGVVRELARRLEQGPPGGVLNTVPRTRWAMPNRDLVPRPHSDLDAVQRIGRDEEAGRATIGLTELDAVVDELRAARDALADRDRAYRELASALDAGTEYPVELIAQARKWRALVAGLVAQLETERKRHEAALSLESGRAAFYRSAALCGESVPEDDEVRAKIREVMGERAAPLATEAKSFDALDGIAAVLGVPSTVEDVLRTIERVRTDRDRKDRNIHRLVQERDARDRRIGHLHDAITRMDEIARSDGDTIERIERANELTDALEGTEAGAVLTPTPRAYEAQEAALEAAYWALDAKRKDQAERDAFKRAVRPLLLPASAWHMIVHEVGTILAEAEPVKLPERVRDLVMRAGDAATERSKREELAERVAKLHEDNVRLGEELAAVYHRAEHAEQDAQRWRATQEAAELRRRAVDEAWSGALSGLEEAERLDLEAAAVLARTDVPAAVETPDEVIKRAQLGAIKVLRRARSAEARLRKIDAETVERLRQIVAVEGLPDDSPVADAARYMLGCARSWEPGARIIGNAKAEDVARVAVAALEVAKAQGLYDAVARLRDGFATALTLGDVFDMIVGVLDAAGLGSPRSGIPECWASPNQDV
jgi:hypothetical protein